MYGRLSRCKRISPATRSRNLTEKSTWETISLINNEEASETSLISSTWRDTGPMSWTGRAFSRSCLSTSTPEFYEIRPTKTQTINPYHRAEEPATQAILPFGMPGEATPIPSQEFSRTRCPLSGGFVSSSPQLLSKNTLGLWDATA
jgi:hypothetical protein